MNSEHFLKEACRVIRKGRGFPAMFNAEAVIEQQLRVGKTISDARGGGICGCVESGRDYNGGGPKYNVSSGWWLSRVLMMR